jgi:hypothetical protein
MRTKRIITEVTAKRYRTADRKGKTRIPDEFVKTTGSAAGSATRG